MGGPRCSRYGARGASAQDIGGAMQRCPTRGLHHSVEKGQFEKRRTHLRRQMPVSLRMGLTSALAGFG